MAAAVFGALVADVLVAFVLHLQGLGRQGGLQAGADFRQSLFAVHFGITRIKGLTSTDSQAPDSM